MKFVFKNYYLFLNLKTEEKNQIQGEKVRGGGVGGGGGVGSWTSQQNLKLRSTLLGPCPPHYFELSDAPGTISLQNTFFYLLTEVRRHFLLSPSKITDNIVPKDLRGIGGV